MSTIAIKEALEQLPVKELEASLEAFLSPMMEPLPDRTAATGGAAGGPGHPGQRIAGGVADGADGGAYRERGLAGGETDLSDC